MYHSALLNVGWAYKPGGFSAWPTTSAVFLLRDAAASDLQTPRSATMAPVRITLNGSRVPGVRYEDDKHSHVVQGEVCCIEFSRNSYMSVFPFFACFGDPVLCRVWSRQPAEVSGVFNEVRWRDHRHAAVWMLVFEPTVQSAELQPEGLWSQVVQHWVECCEWDDTIFYF